LFNISSKSIGLITLCAFIALAGVNLSPAQAAQAASSADIVAMINDRPITRQEFYDALEREAGEVVLNQLIAEALIMEEGEAKKIRPSKAEIDAQYAAIRAEYGSDEEFDLTLMANRLTPERLRYEIELTLILNTLAFEGVVVTDQEMLDFFYAHAEELSDPAQARVSHIVVATKEEAEVLYSRLQKGEDFASLAKSYSLDRDTARLGGDVGYIAQNEPLIEGFREVIDSLGLGEFSRPVKSEDGYHILMVTERILAKPATFSSRRDYIRQVLMEQKAKSFDEVINTLYNKYDVKVHWDSYKHLGNTD